MMHRAAELAPSPPGVEVCSCDEALALRAELARVQALLDEPTSSVDSRAFCPNCGVADLGMDEDVCTSCGSDVCSMPQVVALLAAGGFRVVPMPAAFEEGKRAFEDARQNAIEDYERSESLEQAR